jgi:hypothetical protein
MQGLASPCGSAALRTGNVTAPGSPSNLDPHSPSHTMEGTSHTSALVRCDPKLFDRIFFTELVSYISFVREKDTVMRFNYNSPITCGLLCRRIRRTLVTVHDIISKLLSTHFSQNDCRKVLYFTVLSSVATLIAIHLTRTSFPRTSCQYPAGYRTAHPLH